MTAQVHARRFAALRQLRAMTGKELRLLARDRALLFYAIYIFTLDILLAASALNTELHRAVVVVHDADRTAASRELLSGFRPPYFEFGGMVADPQEGMRFLDQGDAMVLLDIPDGFNATLIRGERQATVQVLVDTTKASRGFLASSYTAQIADLLGRQWTERRLRSAGMNAAALPVIVHQRRTWYNPGFNENWYNSLAELLTMITVACLLLPAAALVREREHGTIEQLLVSPVSPFQVMLSKVLGMILVTLVGTAVSVFGIMRPVFGVPFEGSAFLFLSLTALYAFTTAGLGLAAATFARNSAQVGMLVLLMVVPINMLSGDRTPLEFMPQWLQALTNIFPLRHFIEIAFGVVLRGAGWAEVWRAAAIMAFLGCCGFGLGVWRFRRQFA